MKIQRLLLGLFVSTLTLASQASTYLKPEGYEVPAIRLRADSSHSLNLPPHTILGLDDPLFLDNRDIFLKFLSFGGEESTGILKWSQDQGLDVHSISADSYASGLSLDPASGDILYEQINYGYFSEGVMRISSRLENPRREFFDRNYLFTSSPQGLREGRRFVVREQKDDGSQGIALLSSNGQVQTLVTSASRHASSPYSYLFPQQAIEDGRVVLKVRHGEAGQIGERQGDEIVLVSTTKDKVATTSLLRDADLDAASPFASFDNTGAVNTAGDIAWIVKLKSGRRALAYKAHDQAVRILAEEGQGGLRELQPFRASLNLRGDIVFRARDSEGREGVWRAEAWSGKVYPLIRENDRLKTDRGAALVGVKGDFPGVIYAAPQLNARGDILVGALLRSEETGRDLGLGYFVVEPMQ
jgi:hypothetical protein